MSEKANVTELDGATAGKSKMLFGVPLRKTSVSKFSGCNQFVELFVIVYPHPTVEPGGQPGLQAVGARHEARDGRGEPAAARGDAGTSELRFADTTTMSSLPMGARIS
jgi:hypothetical protein